MSGTDLKTKQLLQEGPAIILVEPQLGENIGMVARAMANFGLSEMRLVNPRDGWPSEAATKAASGAVHVTENAVVHDTVEAAVADLNFLVATTARPRDIVKTVREPVDTCAGLRKRFEAGEKTGILFGRERWGLNNDEIILCDEICTFPVNPAFASLNIAQAVLLMSYEWLKSSGNREAVDAFETRERTLAERHHMTGLLDHLESALKDAGYFFPPERAERMTQTVRNIFVNMQLYEQEVQTLRGIIAALEGRRQKRRDAAAENSLETVDGSVTQDTSRGADKLEDEA